MIYKELQVDLITVNAEEFDYALDYFSYNDLGNLRGKIIHKFGIKHGHKGLFLPVRNEHTLLGEILLTRDPNVTNKLFDVEIKHQINTLEDIFQVITESKFFNPQIFSFEEMNAIARVRDKKRSTYNGFLKYIDCDKFKSKNYFQFNKEKSTYLDMIFSEFPDAKVEYQQIHDLKLKKDICSTKFNGEIVSELTGLKGFELGILMRKLKAVLTNDKINQLTNDEIKNVINKIFNNESLRLN